MRVGYGFEEVLFSVIIYLIVGAALFLFIQILIYSTITVKNYRKRRSLKNRLPAWTEQIEDYLRRRGTRARFHLRGEEKKAFRDMVIGYYCGVPQDASNDDLHKPLKLRGDDKRRLRMLYRELGFVEEDLDQIKDGTWWTKSVALGRLSRLELNDAEDLAVDLMETEHRELTVSCISYLASIKSRYLHDRLDEVFQITEEAQFNEVATELSKADIGIGQLKKLADCDVRSGRKAAAILLGRKGLHHSTAVLKKLAADPFEDVRLEVARSLGRIGSLKAIRVLETLDHDPDVNVRKLAQKEIKRVRSNLMVTSIWDLEMDDRRTDDLLDNFSKESSMQDDNYSIMGF
ncbi:MAG: HEAT repeat domain-containing protein [Thermoplasmatota archaeon]